MSVALQPTHYISTSEAARRLGVAAETLRLWWEQGWVAGAERRGAGRRPRFYWDAAELRYTGPTRKPGLSGGSQPAASISPPAKPEPLVVPPNPFRYRPRK